MGLETGTFIDDFVTTNPTGSDVRAQGDDHLRLIKLLVKNTFPNADREFRLPEAPVAKTGAYTILATDANALIQGDTSGGGFLITLPLLSTVFPGFEVTVMRSAGSSTLGVDTPNSETINGFLTRSFRDLYTMETYRADASEWKVVSAVGSLESGDTTSAEGPGFDLNRDSTTPADDDFIGAIRFRGRDSAANRETYAKIRAKILDVTSGSEDAWLEITTVVAGAATDRLRIGGGLWHGSATGGDKGNNTINFGAVYDDNVVLTCYVFDQYLDGEISMNKWDELVADPPDEIRIHKDARKFASRAGSETDPLNIDKYADHWKKKRHLTSMPNEAKFDPEVGMPTGAWIQRLLETVEIQAIHIEQLNQRVKNLESRVSVGRNISV